MTGFIKEEERAGLEVGGKGLFCGDNGFHGGKTLSETTEDGEDESFVGDLVVEIAEGVSQGFEPLTIRHDWHVALGGAAELGLQADDAHLLVIPKEALDALPNGMSRGTGREDDGKHLLGDGAVEPRNDGVVVEIPVRRRVGGPGGVDVRFQGEPVEKDEEELTPCGVVGRLELEIERNKGFHVHHVMRHGRSGSLSIAHGDLAGGRGWWGGSVGI